MKRTLVAYFSASGITKKIADTGQFDLFEIKPGVAYTKEDLDWMDKNSRSSVEMENRKIRPEMEAADINLKGYDRILLGFPIWWYVAPTIVNTFLEAYDFSGKEIILFATSGGSGFGHTVHELQPSAPEALIKEGKIWNRANRKEMKEWIDAL